MDRWTGGTDGQMDNRRDRWTDKIKGVERLDKADSRRDRWTIGGTGGTDGLRRMVRLTIIFLLILCGLYYAAYFFYITP